MGNELQNVYEQIMQAVCSEDVFGVDGETPTIQLESVKRVYRRLSKIVHPDHYTSDANAFEMAGEAFGRLGQFYQRAQDKIKAGTYGKRLSESNTQESDFVIQTRKREYHIKSVLAQGDLCTIYGGDCAGGDDFAGQIAVKIVEDPEDNLLMQNEVKILKLFQVEPSKQSKHLPVLLDQFKTSDGRLGTILRHIDGYDLYSVRESEKYKNGVPSKLAVWVLERLLSVCGLVHSKGVIHGNIEPAHIMVRMKDHNAWLIDLCYAALNPGRTRDGFKVLNEDYSPPEVQERKSPLPSSDLYSLGKCMIYLLGGDIKTNTMPALVEKPLQRFIQFFVMKSPLQRAQDAWEMYEKLAELRTELWGPKKFLEFEM